MAASSRDRVHSLEIELAKAIAMDDTESLTRLQREAQDWIVHEEQSNPQAEVRRSRTAEEIASNRLWPTDYSARLLVTDIYWC